MFRNLINFFFFSKELKIFSISSLFYLSLYFSTSNKITLILSVLATFLLYQQTKKIIPTIFYIFLLVLPFAKGKGIDIFLLSKSQIKNGLFDISYLFPIYLSSPYLLLFYYFYARNKLFSKDNLPYISFNTKQILTIFFIFFAICLSQAITSNLFLPITLASLQLVILLATFFMPFIMKLKNHTNLYLVIASSTLFQSVWLIFQNINRGYLGKDIEVHLAGIDFAIQSSENPDLLRLPGTFFESSILGTFLLTNLTILLYSYLHQIKNWKQKLIIKITCILAIVAILLTGSRAIYTILILVFLSIAKSNGTVSISNLKKLIQKRGSIFYVGVISIMIFFAGPYFLNRIQSITQVFTKHGSGTYRIELTKLAWQLFEQKPLFGTGLETVTYYFASIIPSQNSFVDPARPHNIFVQLLAETGVVGLLLFFIFLYLILKETILPRNKNKEFHFAAIIFIVCAQFYPIFINHMEIVSYLFLYLGFAAYENQKNELTK